MRMSWGKLHCGEYAQANSRRKLQVVADHFTAATRQQTEGIWCVFLCAARISQLISGLLLRALVNGLL